MNTETNVAHSGVAGCGGTVAIVWIWNLWNPDKLMPAEVAAAVVPMVGGVLAWVINAITKKKPNQNA